MENSLVIKKVASKAPTAKPLVYKDLAEDDLFVWSAFGCENSPCMKLTSSTWFDFNSCGVCRSSDYYDCRRGIDEVKHITATLTWSPVK